MTKVKVLLLFILVLSVSHVYSLQIQDLGGTWFLTSTDGEYKNLSAVVPGGIYTDLMKNDIIGDIFFGDNDIKTRWVALKSWRYDAYVTVDAGITNHRHINLVFDGLDTFSQVYVNNQLVGSSDNMFIRYVFDISKVIKPDQVNLITVIFSSPVEKANEIYEEQLKDYEVPPQCVPDYYNGECHVNHIRKMQASFSWDWGPAFPSVGIWKQVSIEAFNSSLIRDITIATKELDDYWEITTNTYFAINEEKTLIGSLNINIRTDFGDVQYRYDIELTGNEEFISINTFKISKANFKLWWPNGMGEQNLYIVKVTFLSDDRKEQTTKRIRIGFRTIELNQSKLDKGRTFHFIVNGVEMFAKGTNIIPTHILPELGQNITKIKFLLQSSKDVHMNMIRIWGGGVYESDLFYNMADEMGLLIWQDLMFACSMYPTSDNFLSIVKEEVKQQIRRLQHHASVAIWAGNNENEAALRGNWYGTAKNFSLYKDDYVKLYVDAIRPVVLENDATRTYLTSSPTNGIESDINGHVAENPYDPLYGDIHYYNYVFDSWNQNYLPTPRFASEYGFQSLPSANTILTATNNISDLSIYSKFMISRQHHVGGYDEMLLLITARLNLPKSAKNFDLAYIFYSQIVQAMAIKIQTEHYRQLYSIYNDDGQGGIMGALYWQLNDVWVAPSWAGIDFMDNWKMQHYYAKDFFAPTIVSPRCKTNHEVDIFVISDEIGTRTANLTLKTYKWSSFEDYNVYTQEVEIIKGSQIVHSFWIEEYLNDIKCGNQNSAHYDCFFQMVLTDEFDQLITPINYLFPAPLKDASITHANVKISEVSSLGGNQFSITVESDAIATFVWLESEYFGTFSENGFIQVEPDVKVIFTASADILLADFKKSLSVTHLLDPIYI